MTARNHHYLPQCYLKNFARDPRAPQLFVVDGPSARAFRTGPRNIAAEKDFNRVDVDGHPPDAIERAYAGFENELGPALARIVAAKSIANDEDRTYLLNLVGLVALRTPRFREMTRGFQERTTKMMMRMMVADPERLAKTVEGAREAGYLRGDKVAHAVDYETLKKFVEEDQFRIEVSTTRHVQMETENFNNILPLLFERQWTLLRAPPKGRTLITCDHPYVLLWIDPARRGKFPPPGLGLRQTEVLFPISSDLALSGTFEGESGERQLHEREVPMFNGIMIAHAERQVYARDDQFQYIRPPARHPRLGATLVADDRFVGRQAS